ncbi:MAG: sigma-54 dependent transcriptional regulator [Deltaproteobacteria bacterium]|nr:sigma-54 dependent transcriptional regulator [Deltaproteobacteria bacterium]
MPDILIVEDEESLREVLKINFKRQNYSLDCAESFKQAKEFIDKNSYDVVLTDYRLKGSSGFDVLKYQQEKMPLAQTILMTAYATVENAIEALKLGAYHYLIKPLKMEELNAIVGKAIETARILKENYRLKEQLRKQYAVEGIIGKSPKMVKIFDLVKKIAETKTTILITGQSGTGKEVIARAIHGLSRREGEFIVVNCGALPESLFESELFGHVKGAFTDAKFDKRGLVEEANKGTLFLDEITEIPLNLQVKLLGLLQSSRARRVGDTREYEVDIRVIAATNKNIESEVEKGRFREDLYYRVNVIRIELPPLKERKEDIPLLVDNFIRLYSAEQNKAIQGISEDALKLIMNYDFPGNVRQLENIIERAVTLTKDGKIGMDVLPDFIRNTSCEPVSSIYQYGGIDLDAKLMEIEKEAILSALKEANGKKTQAARLLGLSFRSFRYRCQKYGIAADEEEAEENKEQ